MYLLENLQDQNLKKVDTPIDNSNRHRISGILQESTRTVSVLTKVVFPHVQSLPAHQTHKSLS